MVPIVSALVRNPVISVVVRNRDFRLLFIAELVVFGADWFAVVPLVSLLHELTGSGLPGAVALTAETAVAALVLPYAGTIADRFDRRRTMITASLAVLAAATLLFAVRSPGTAWIGPVAIGLAAAVKPFYGLAAGAALPNVVDSKDLPAANALAGSAWGTMLVVGASLGGVVSAAVSPYACFAIAVAAIGVAAVLTSRIRRPLQGERDHSQPLRPLRALTESLAYIRSETRVLSLVTVKSAVGLGNGVLAVFPVLSAVFGAGSIGTGLLFAARGLGALSGPLLMRRVLTRSRWLMPAMAASMIVYGISYLGVAASPWFGLTLMLVVVAHMAGGGNWTVSSYALQVIVPDRLLGRVLAADQVLSTAAISVTMLMAGLMVDHVDARVPIAVCASLTLLYGVGWRLVTRRLLREPAPASASA